ncbi:50S ribosomal protein L30 [bacterium]|nr:MAG: 50S ribosomal protein L30 [bacterium]
MLRIELFRSVIGQHPRNRKTVAALGLRKPHHVLEKEDTPSIRGMIHNVAHMLIVTDLTSGEVIVDARKIKRRTLTRDHKPPETH